MTSAEAAWQGRTDLDHPTNGGPVFAPDWHRPARTPQSGVPEADLSVQLSAWMLLEAAARTASGVAPQAPTDPA
jgi:predicted alpha-1,6-mannanase (GH76 family)